MKYPIRIPIPALLVVALLLTACQQKRDSPLFESVPPTKSGLDFINRLEETDSMNIIQYLYFYNGGGVAVGDLNQDELPDLFFTANQSANKLYLNRGDFTFEEVTGPAGILQTGNWSTGVNIVDVNADGRLDIYVCQVGNYKGFRGRNQLFINQGLRNGIPYFEEQAAAYGLDHSGFSTQSVFFDYDLDGDLDMYLLCHSVHSTETYRDTSSTRRPNARAGDKLYRNDGSSDGGPPRFTEVSREAGINSGIAGYGLSAVIGDVDQNGCPDIYVGNDFHENDFLYLNNCDGTFREVIAEVSGHTSTFSMGSDLADINNDGWTDVMTLDMKPEVEFELKNAQGSDPYDIYRFKRSFGYHDQLPRNMLQVNQGADATGHIRFSEQGQMARVDATDWSWSVLMADLDNDTWKDLYITNGIIRRPNNLDYLNYIASQKVQEQASDLELAAQMPSGKVHNYLFRNTGAFPLEEVSEAWGMRQTSYSNGAVVADLDLDGDLDLVTNNINEPAFLHRNRTAQLGRTHYLQLSLQGDAGNPLGVGAEVRIWSEKKLQVQYLAPVRGFQSSQGYLLHFGLGEATQVDSLWITWPDGTQTFRTNIPVDQRIRLEKKDASPGAFPTPARGFFATETDFPMPAFLHRENDFYDNKREALIPYLLSTQGPRIAAADVNGDGRTDIFIGGASGQPGQLFLQSASGGWQPRAIPDLEQHRDREDTDLQFLDADGDGDADLYIGSGGNEYYRDDPRLRDRLYLNDGQGNFRFAPAALPEFYGQTATVRPADYDGDGDLDIFVGIRSIPVSYGISPDSYLLDNQGDGTFRLNTSTIPDLEALGMVTDAQWMDTDGDQDLDLVVVGDWMPITFLKQEKNGFVKEELSGTEGWWNTLHMADIDGDGDKDFLAGNFGWNSTLRPSPEEPVGLYVGDIDGNLSNDPVLTYYRAGKKYTLEDLDGLAKQLIFLKKRFRQYEEFASSTFSEVFRQEELDGTRYKQATTFSSSLIRNEGRGRFTVQPLPMAAQVAPVFAVETGDFNRDGHSDILLAGNLFEIKPLIGRMDASQGTLLLGDGTGGFRSVPNAEANLWLTGAVRDIQSVRVGEEEVILVARNHAPLQVIKKRPPSKRETGELMD